MSNNINTTNTNSTLILNKISELSNRLKIISQTSSVGQTQEELIIEANLMINTLFANIAGPIFNPAKVIPNIKPDATDYNTNLSAILSDLTILLAELQNIGNAELSNFNFMISTTNRLIAKLKSCYSKLGDYILYSQDITKDSIYFSDSFTNLSRVDFNSKFISTTQCDINQFQGIITLPVDQLSQKPIQLTITPVINSNSNGTPGNNVQAGAALNNDINSILDNNPDTWFEYENVILDDSASVAPLILDITLNLGPNQIINNIVINPNNFGTKNNIVIDTIETSSDGKTFLDIKDDIPPAGFENSTSDDTSFIISADSSKFSGQAMYSFLPRYAQFIHLVFRQTTPYTILDSTGTQRDRYAIGIRDISVAAIPYVNEGELISNSFISSNEIKKLELITNQFPDSDSSLLSIDHYISPDDGLTWYPISASDFTTTDTTLPVILNFNTLDNNSINTASPVLSLRYKVVLNRNDDNFNNPSATLTTETISVSELRPVPTNSPFNILLNDTPIQTSLKLVDPTFGSRGVVTNRYVFGFGTGGPLILNLPFAPIKKDKQKIPSGTPYLYVDADPEQIRVDGIVWTRGNLTTAASIDKIYELNYTTGQISFGDGVHGKAVPSGASIDIMFLPEVLKPTSDVSHICKLDYTSSNDKKTFNIKRYGQSIITNELLKKGANVNILSHQYVDTSKILVFSDEAIFALPKQYINGSKELVNPGDYSIDVINGVVYSQLPTSSITNTTVRYTYTDIITLNDTDWDFVGDDYSSISIHDDVFVYLKQVNLLSQGDTYAALAQGGIQKGSVQFSGPDLSAVQKEVAYVDGHTELIQGIQTIESIGALHAGLNTYAFRLPISDSPDLNVVFSNPSIFNSEQTSLGAVTSSGQYYINRTGNTLSVFAGTDTLNAGTANYYYDDLMKLNTGLYSINYITGELFTALPIGLDLVITFNYGYLVAEYNISRAIDPLDFTYDLTTNTINISEREILKRINLTSRNSTQTNYYQVLYNKIADNSAELKLLAPYFSPILCDYALKCIPESSLLF